MSKTIDNNKLNENCGFDNGFQTNNNQNTQAPKKDLLDTLTSFLPLAPMVIEQFTGRKVPAIGSLADIQVSLNNLALDLQAVNAKQNQLDNQQQQIFAKLANLEQNANNHLLSLDKRLANLRLTHEQRWEKKQIEHNNPRNNLEEE